MARRIAGAALAALAVGATLSVTGVAYAQPESPSKAPDLEIVGSSQMRV